MSLTSYRAAPPRDKPVGALGESLLETGKRRGLPRQTVSKGFLRRQPGANADRVRAVCTNAAPLWKGFGARFFRFYDAQIVRKPLETGRSCQNSGKGPASSRINQPKRGNAMDQSLKSPPLSALDDAFHAQFDASRAEAVPSCEVRIDRLRRPGAPPKENKTRL